MSSPGKEDTEMKAGHPAAVKAGKMRITQHKSPAEKIEKPEVEDEEEFPDETGVTKSEKHNQSILIAGAVTKGDKDFTADAIKSYHDKPQPAKERRPMQPPHHIQQPAGKR